MTGTDGELEIDYSCPAVALLRNTLQDKDIHAIT